MKGWLLSSITWRLTMVHVATKKVRSSSSKRTYSIKIYDDGSFWCSCPGFKFQRGKVAKDRACKHTRKLVQRGLV